MNIEKYITLVENSYKGYWNYLWQEILFQSNWNNYFYGLILISLLVWGLEIKFPWRKNQPIFRDDFWIDLFYMFFNFFLLNLIVLIALSNVATAFFNELLAIGGWSIANFQLVELNNLPVVLRLLLFFVITDFVQWNIHKLLHTFPFLWSFHKVHHSIKQMGFAGHLRYHWLEPIVYKSLLYIPLAIIGGFNVNDVAFIHFFTLIIGHLNHANLGWDYGLFKYIFNNPKMHIWHHSKKIPNKYGVNFGISLSIWDYIFKTNFIPKSGRDIVLGFDGDESFPKSFISQEIIPFKKKF